MYNHSETRILPYKTGQLFKIVADIESYPDFLPWVAGARVENAGQHELTAELAIRFKMVSDKYTSHVALERPLNDHAPAEIKVFLVEGPFKQLNNNWAFRPLEGDKTSVFFEINFEFKSKILDSMMGAMFDEAASTMVSAFEKRAHEMYSSKY